MMNNLSALIDSFAGKRVMVVGDVMIDSYLWGVVDRISPEAPVPVVDVSNREERPGGAANVAVNIRALGATPLLCSVIGRDIKGDAFMRIMQEERLDSRGIYRSESRITTTKFRIIGNNSQMLRVDEEHTHDLAPDDEFEFLNTCKAVLKDKNVDVMIIQDYNKGILTAGVISTLIAEARGQNIAVVVDPKKKNFDLYRGVSLFKPNLKEMKEGLNIEFAEPDETLLRETASILADRIKAEITMVTLSENGIFIASGQGPEQRSILLPAHVRNIADVSGAGDTVVSVASLCLAAGASLEEIATASNLAGGIVCEKVGVVPIELDHLRKELLKIGQ